MYTKREGVRCKCDVLTSQLTLGTLPFLCHKEYYSASLRVDIPKYGRFHPLPLLADSPTRVMLDFLPRCGSRWVFYYWSLPFRGLTEKLQEFVTVYCSCQTSLVERNAGCVDLNVFPCIEADKSTLVSYLCDIQFITFAIHA